ncbi:TetR/AcrR family transcriptional regulator [Paraglaciecola arctica]|uniref:TetR/AcrR family transcriptional regulator n=1 Tax=Paraglaciecola arctica TaxID=1128911 RepID=UPI001C07AE04|nr:TetR/AcrR family transcriptional regulator [Paraglaciecola arctica]MBU3003917.1 TetR/AcrR family transcriptional regulator [Paraglaciecola arctica]
MKPQKSEVLEKKMPEPSGKRARKTTQMMRTKQAVLDTVVELLSEIGYRAITIEIISQRCGVARSTIYRHWKNIPELTIDAFDSAIGDTPEFPEQGDVRSNLVFLYRQFGKSLSRSIWGRVLPSLIEASHNDPKFENYLSSMANVRRQNAREMLQRAKSKGELKPEANVEWILDTLSGALYHRLLITGTALDEPGLVDWLIDSVLSTTLQKD